MTKIELYSYNVAKYGPSGSEFASYSVYRDAKERRYDVYVIGIQEVPNAEVVGVELAEKTWKDFITRMLTASGLTLVYCKYMLANLILVFGDYRLLQLTRQIQTRTVGYTWRGALGYKGTVGVRFELRNGRNLVLLTSHFTHGDDNKNVRLKQFEQGRYCTFEDVCDEKKTVIFWMGDFNSRMNDDSTKELSHAAETDRDLFSEVCQGDQLFAAMTKKTMFHGYVEPIVDFPPTYRMIIKSDVYDLARKPSWCDRVLVKSNHMEFKKLEYDVDLGMLNSDHLPVFAVYEVPDLFSDRDLADSLCVFQNIPSWSSSVYFMCHFYFPGDYYATSGSMRDWVGIYKFPVANVMSPTYWMYVAFVYQCENEHNLAANKVALKHTAEASKLAKGDYVAAYYSVSLSSFIGISNVFSVDDQ